jgi:hypothetical protein
MQQLCQVGFEDVPHLGNQIESDEQHLFHRRETKQQKSRGVQSKLPCPLVLPEVAPYFVLNQIIKEAALTA